MKKKFSSMTVLHLHELVEAASDYPDLLENILYEFKIRDLSELDDVVYPILLTRIRKQVHQRNTGVLLE